MLWYIHKIKIGKRDRFWLTVVVLAVAVLLVLRSLSRDGFSDSGKPVWKSADLAGKSLQDTLRSQKPDSLLRNRASAFQLSPK
ncbi:MAG TPA: hypothetical protein VMM37_04550 [Bacteroidota bacterium]|nr:hypothetical protein [Bacteroidota bacterium]